MISRYLRLRRYRLQRVWGNPQKYQEAWLQRIINKGGDCIYTRKYDLHNVENYWAFSKALPIVEYEDICVEVEQMMKGASNLLWPGKVTWFAKSSGTTNQKSKFIPVTKNNLQEGHIFSAWDTMALLYDKLPDAKMFSEKSLLVGGALEHFEENPETIFGDISAILINQMPAVGRPFYTPDFDTAMIRDWDIKLEKIAQISAKENVVMIGGVPTWNIVLFRRILEITGKSNLKEVWPDLQAYVHGGVSFEPYQTMFQDLIPDKNLIYQEIYNASEGYFAVQDRKNEKGMALLLDNAIFYEFVPVSEWHTKQKKAIPVWEVELGVNYVMVITNNAGLWRYAPGDTVTFISKNPHRIKITGRIRHFINAFGEEVMVANTDKALAEACKSFDALAGEYTVAPVYFSERGRGFHEWLIEFEKPPHDLDFFQKNLDKILQSINSDYQAKRYKSMALKNLQIHALEKGSFENWLRAHRTMGAQVKVPRLSNNRDIINSMKSFFSIPENS